METGIGRGVQRGDHLVSKYWKEVSIARIREKAVEM